MKGNIVTELLQAIKRLSLDLKGKTVLTEGATGHYAVTPVLAALAGAQVYAFAKDSSYGSVQDVKNQVEALGSLFDDVNERIEVITSLEPTIIGSADIITCSGHLRPLDFDKLQHAKSSVVVPLMFEKWEYRAQDLDLDYCKRKDIPVGGTNERHSDVGVFEYLGAMAEKLMADAEVSLQGNKFILICNNDFGRFIAKYLVGKCAGLAVCSSSTEKEAYLKLGADWIGDFPEFDIPEAYKDAEGVIFTAYPFTEKWIGPKDIISISKLKEQLSNPKIFRFAGDVDEQYCLAHQTLLYPANVKSGHMGVLPSAVGIEPIIRLQSGGLKVGELMLRRETSHNNEELVQYL